MVEQDKGCHLPLTRRELLLASASSAMVATAAVDAAPSSTRPSSPKAGVPTAQAVNCVTKDPGVAEVASLAPVSLPKSAYTKFTSQDEMGQFLIDHYKIRTPRELSSCEVCHR